jgi:hypothetical protein
MAMGGDVNALNTLGPSWWWGQREDHDSDEGLREGHYPYARHVRSGWQQDSSGKWVPTREDPNLWEVFCAQCGDVDGPAENQSEAVRRLRGPYASKRKAAHVAKRHFYQMSNE